MKGLKKMIEHNFSLYSRLADHQIWSLKKYGNTVIGAQHFENIIRVIWKKRYPDDIMYLNDPEVKLTDIPYFKRKRDVCFRLFLKDASKICGFEISMRESIKFIDDYEVIAGHRTFEKKESRTLVLHDMILERKDLCKTWKTIEKTTSANLSSTTLNI